MVDEAVAIAEQTAREASSVAGATQQQAASLSEMSDSATDLAHEADE
jgi:methyl-accepting chemotaxis protein